MQAGPLPPEVQFWAKTTCDGRPGISVLEHCLNVGAVAEQLLKTLPRASRGRSPSFAPVLAALHDVGKAAPGFQVKCERWLLENGLRERAIRECWSLEEDDHGKVTQATLQEVFSGRDMWKWAAALGAHHGRLKGGERVLCKASWQEQRRRMVEAIVRDLGKLPDQPPKSDAELWWVAGLVTVADWIGSDERFFPCDRPLDAEQRRRRAQEALEQIGWAPPRYRAGVCFGQMFPGYKPNNLQRIVLDVVREPGVYVIEAPMGMGKTEAALAAAYELLRSGAAAGIYFALPTQLTSNRIYRRVEAFIQRICAKDSRVRLAHSASWLLESDLPPSLPASGPAGDEEVPAGDLVRSWFASSRRALLEPFGVGTVDQALLGVVAARHFFLRQFALAGKVVILDEVHSYDVYTGALICRLVRQLRELQATVIILSATLTRSRKAELLGLQESLQLSSAYPLVSAKKDRLEEISVEAPPPKRIVVRWREAAALATECVERAEQGCCVLWICNTVAGAQQAYRRVKSLIREGGPPVGLLHSRFPMVRREEIEQFWMEALGRHGPRPPGCILVATQVVEQSVDVDADLLVTDLAPTDMLLQRIGRLWRHERGQRPAERPEVWIEKPGHEEVLEDGDQRKIRDALGVAARVYAPYVLLRTWEAWRRLDEIQVPGMIRELLEQTYEHSCEGEPGAWRELHDELVQQRAKLSDLAWNATRIWDRRLLDDDEGVRTRYESLPTAHLLPLLRIQDNGLRTEIELLNHEVVEVQAGEWRLETAKRLHQWLIRVPLWAAREGVQRRPEWLRQYADPAAVALLQSDGRLAWHPSGESSGLSYQPEFGLWIEEGHSRTALGKDECDESWF
jgi:CRISPR-associated endonuclease/helicase Cas3